MTPKAKSTALVLSGAVALSFTAYAIGSQTGSGSADAQSGSAKTAPARPAGFGRGGPGHRGGPGFGAAFDPAQVVTEADWGSLTVEFAGCGHGTFRYATRYGDGVAAVVNLTLPPEARCKGG